MLLGRRGTALLSESDKLFKAPPRKRQRVLFFTGLLLTLCALGMFWFSIRKNHGQSAIASVDRQQLLNFPESKKLPFPDARDLSVKIAAASAIVAAKHGYAVVVDKKVIVSGAVDITAEVLAILQSGKPLLPPLKLPSQSAVGIIDQDLLFSAPRIRSAKEKYSSFLLALARDYKENAAKLSQHEKQELLARDNALLGAYQKAHLKPLLAQLEKTIKAVALEKKLSCILNREDVLCGGTNITEEVMKKAEAAFPREISEGPDTQSLAVVDLPKLIPLHPSFPRIGEINREIDDWRNGEFGIAETLLSPKDLARWEKAQKEARDAWEKDLQKLTNQGTDVQSKAPALNKPLPDEKETAKIQTALNNDYEEAVKKKMEELKKAYARQGKKVQEQTEAALRAYAGQLLKFRNERLSVVKYELLSQLQDDLKRQASSYEEEYLQFEKKLMEKDQPKRLDLQLKLAVLSPKEKEAVQGKLSELENQEKKEKQAKQEELQEKLAKIRDAGLAQVSRNLQKLALSLDQKASEKIQKKRNELFLAAGKALEEEQANLQSELAEFKGTALLNAKQEVSRKFKNSSALSTQSLALSSQEELRQRLLASKIQIESKLQGEEKQILSHSKDYLDTLSAIKKGDTQLVSKVIANLEKEKNDLLLSMRNDILKQAELLAKQEGIKTVLTDVAVNVNARDLTKEVAKRLHP